jgi:hypothetical protein
LTRLAFDAANSAVPQTHALLIGVGEYAHLQDGVSPAEVTYGLGQLLSPPASVAAFARLLLDKRNDLIPPLGSLSVLCSGGSITDNHGTIDAGAPLMGEISTAFKEWRSRSESNAENLALFYFCGHGIDTAALVLLPEDFLADPANLDERAINFSHTYRAMDACIMRRQLFFIDCCRNAPRQLSDVGLLGVSLSTSTAELQQSPYRSVYYAAREGQQAHAAPGRTVSYFTKAVIDGLEGRAAARQDSKSNRWVVRTTALTEAISAIMSEQGRRWSSPGEVSVLDIAFCDQGKAWTSVTCQPESALRDAHFRVFCDEMLHDEDLPPRNGPWQFMLPAGKYDFRAALPEDLEIWKRGQIVLPPTHDCVLP